MEQREGPFESNAPQAKANENMLDEPDTAQEPTPDTPASTIFRAQDAPIEVAPLTPEIQPGDAAQTALDTQDATPTKAGYWRIWEADMLNCFNLEDTKLSSEKENKDNITTMDAPAKHPVDEDSPGDAVSASNTDYTPSLAAKGNPSAQVSDRASEERKLPEEEGSAPEGTTTAAGEEAQNPQEDESQGKKPRRRSTRPTAISKLVKPKVMKTPAKVSKQQLGRLGNGLSPTGSKLRAVKLTCVKPPKSLIASRLAVDPGAEVSERPVTRKKRTPQNPWMKDARIQPPPRKDLHQTYRWKPRSDLLQDIRSSEGRLETLADETSSETLRDVVWSNSRSTPSAPDSSFDLLQDHQREISRRNLKARIETRILTDAISRGYGMLDLYQEYPFLTAKWRGFLKLYIKKLFE